MKKIFCYLFLLTTPIIAKSQTGKLLTLLFWGNTEKEQNVLGLNMVDLMIINTQPTSIFIDDRGHWRFQATIGEKQIYFSEGVTTFADPMPYMIKPFDTLSVKLSLNFFRLIQNANDSNLLKTLRKIETEIKIGIFCQTDKQSYFSNPLNFTINPLSPADLNAFDYIKSKGFDPYKFTTLDFITSRYVDKLICDSVIVQFPYSSFAELASLSLAFQASTDVKNLPSQNVKLQEFLEKPLGSKYSFVRFLAEGLAKKQ